jgi:hypothetical protein
LETFGEFAILGFFRRDQGVLAWVCLETSGQISKCLVGWYSFVGFLDFGEVVCDVIFIIDVFLTNLKVASAALGLDRRL